MADYQNPQQNPDTSGSTQMFRAFVDDGSTTAQQQPQPSAGAPVTYGSARNSNRGGLIIGVIVALVVIAAVVYFAVA
ncbi:hypothetical protein POF50_019515 [Streptomyces sp. SL13]|jgi:hypothetical protein|uniref:Uncharacterized protein n=1 Tax=Streptantibioticus silvisoli TaxID=2705255 RepID=A0AA90H6J8_9ACTN|nr:hypothetical protein [Streptantibioticus silvisoli]MDI5965685.1 hypothetical protein [Streptantibioticus silvisoli]MDI5971494.1 hypothetical protein [Streptantibioticus silvisoli]